MVNSIAARFFLCLLWVISGIAQGEDNPVDLEQELRRATQQMLDAVAPGEVAVWQRYLHPDFLQMDENGGVKNRAEVLAQLEPLPPGLVGSIAIDVFRVQQAGETAVVALEMQENLDYHGQVLHTRFRSFETWVKTPQGWRLLGQHVAAVLKDPPAIALSREELCAYAGRYRLAEGIETVVRCEEGRLLAQRSGRPEEVFLPEVRDLFFAPGKPRSRRLFLRDADGKIEAFVDRREGEDIRWRKLPDSTRKE